MPLLSLILSLFIVVSAFAESSPELTVYTSRKTHLIEPLFEAYSKKTGVSIKHINGKAGVLIQKIKQEGAKTKADVLITVDAGNLGQAAKMGLLEPLASKSLLQSISKKDRGTNNLWVGLSLRARTIFYNKQKVKKEELASYQGLADEKWRGRLCLRTSRKVYNQSLVAALISRLGEDRTKKIVEGWVNNLTKPVFTSDSQLLEAIDNGICQVGIANTYYLARMIKKGDASNVGVFWPKQSDGGVHVNVSGAGVIKSSAHKKQAVAFLEWLVTKEAQAIFAGLNDEYPVVEGVAPSETIKKWGAFSREDVSLTEIGALQKKAVFLMDSVKYR